MVGITNLPSDAILYPEKYGLVECPHCNGYGSSLKEEADRCTVCGGTGLLKKKQAEEYRLKHQI